jgi:hypothetical protein
MLVFVSGFRAIGHKMAIAHDVEQTIMLAYASYTLVSDAVMHTHMGMDRVSDAQAWGWTATHLKEPAHCSLSA